MTDHDKGAALVTGGAQRIGRALALRLAADGYAIALHCHSSQTEAHALAADITGNGGRCAVIEGNLNEMADVERLVPEAEKAVGTLTVLVNNASLFEKDTIFDATPESWDTHLDINLRAPFFLSQAFARQLPPTRKGNIVNLIDMRVWKLTPHFASYTVSKVGLWTLTQTLAMALAPQIRVNGIGPGPSLRNTRQTPEQFAAQIQATPLGVNATPEDLAQALNFILETPSFTGQMLALDGGQHLPNHPLLMKEDPPE